MAISIERDMTAVPGTDLVTVTADEVLIHEFREEDPRVVQVLGESTEPEATVHRMLELGARCLVDTGALLQVETVASQFDRLKDDFERTVQGSTEAVTQITESLVGEDGAIPQAMEDIRESLEAVLDEAFDEDSKSSVLAKFDEVLEQQRVKMIKALSEQLDLEREGSPLARTQQAILEGFEELKESVTEDIQDLRERFVAEKARAAAAEKGTGKGLDFQAALHEVIQPMAATFEDIAEFTANSTGVIKGSKVGDETVLVNRTATGGHEARYVLEAKDKKTSSLEDVLTEVGVAMKNREALVGIAVFSSQAKAPTSTPLQMYDGGHKLVVIVDKQEDGEFTTEGLLALRLACNWARWMAIREVTLEGDLDGVDTQAILEAVGRAQQALSLASNVRRYHTEASNKIDLAGKQVEKVCEGVVEALGAIESEIARAGEGGGA